VTTAPGLEALSEAEIDRLAERLVDNPNQDALSLEEVDGLFCALVASPDSVLPSEYLPVILGGNSGDSAAFADIEDANATMVLLMRYWNSIIADLERDSIHLPYVVEPGVDGIPGRAWARGFLKGTRLAPEGWSDLWDSEGDGQLLSIALVAGELDPTWPKEPLTKEKQDELLQWMFAGAARAYRHFADARREFADAQYDETLEDEEIDDYYPETYVRPEPKVGRNQPCPCGSGKKYKKCCGASDLSAVH
jgi:uncharacterized protein